jgi:hypothetical protein
LGICTSRPFHWYKEHLNTRCFDPWTRALNFWESPRTPTSHFWGCEFHPHTYPKVGLQHPIHHIHSHLWIALVIVYYLLIL